MEKSPAGEGGSKEQEQSIHLDGGSTDQRVRRAPSRVVVYGVYVHTHNEAATLGALALWWNGSVGHAGAH